MKKIIYFMLVQFILVNLYISAEAADAPVPKRIAGSFVGFPVGSIVGGFRGGVTGAKDGTLYAAELYGNKDGSTQRGFGFVTGGLIGGVFGGLNGFLKGAYDGVTSGYSEPFSKKSFSWTGTSVTDYDMYN